MDEFSLAFSLSPLGPKRYQLLINAFETPEKAWKAKELGYEELGITGLTLEKFLNFQNEFNFERYSLQLKKENVTFISFLDNNYPKDLKKLENPPIGLFCKGNVKLLPHSGTGIRIAVVGTRKITEYGKTVTENIVSELVNSNVCIVSGLAIGVDAKAHRTALENDGSTIAVLACGVDCCNPKENQTLYKDILQKNGLVISEYPLSVEPKPGTFLARNRIVSALSDGILITEAAEDSGSLVTAEFGFQLKKKIFAVPGPINSPMAQGSHKLLKQGAKLVTEAKDLVEEFQISNINFQTKSKIKKLNLSKEEKKIVSLLGNKEMTIDEISRKTKLSVSELFVNISGLELRGFVKKTGGNYKLLS